MAYPQFLRRSGLFPLPWIGCHQRPQYGICTSQQADLSSDLVAIRQWPFRSYEVDVATKIAGKIACHGR